MREFWWISLELGNLSCGILSHSTQLNAVHLWKCCEETFLSAFFERIPPEEWSTSRKSRSTFSTEKQVFESGDFKYFQVFEVVLEAKFKVWFRKNQWDNSHFWLIHSKCEHFVEKHYQVWNSSDHRIILSLDHLCWWYNNLSIRWMNYCGFHRNLCLTISINESMNYWIIH